MVVAARDAEHTIGRTVVALREQRDRHGQGVELIVVDDGSRDRTGEVAAAAGARVLRAGGDGPARARNLGVAEAATPLIVFTDADCEPQPEFVAELLAPLDDPAVGGAKGAYLTRQRGWVPRFVQCEYEERYARMARRTSIDFIDTYAAVYRTELFRAVGGFDERYRLPSTEDQELSFRIVERGARLVFVPGARVAHLHAGSLWAYARKKAKIGYYKVATIRRHPGKAVSDAHTPATLKLQLLLGPLVPLGLLAGAAWLALRPDEPGWAGLSLVPAGVFLLTALPLLARVLRRDPPVALGAPLFILVRAWALALGVAAGLLAELRGGVLPEART